MKLHLISAPQKTTLWKSHTNLLTCSIIYVLYFHNFCVYSAPEEVTVAICRCFAVLQSPEKRRSRQTHYPLPSSTFQHCYTVHAAFRDHCEDHNTFTPVQMDCGNHCWMGHCWWKCKDATAGKSKLQIPAWMRVHWESLTL